MKFSVLMSVYHKEDPRFLQEAIDSVINQSVKPTEIVIIEDGPLTDGLYEVLDNFAQNHNIIKRYPLEKNIGLGLALRRGVEICQYDWIARMDSDDVAVSDRFEKQTSHIKAHQGIGLVGSAIEEYDEDMQIKTGIRAVPESHDDILKYMKSRNPLNHMTVMYRKDLVLNAGSYRHCPYFEDYYLWCLLARNGAVFHNIQESLVKVRAGSGFVDRRGGLKYVRYILEFQNKIRKLGIIDSKDYVLNIITRSAIAIIPSSLRAVFYKIALRNNSRAGA